MLVQKRETLSFEVGDRPLRPPTPLHVLLMRDDCDVEVLKRLLKSGCPVNAKFFNNCTALHYAVRRNHPCVYEMAKELLSYRADPNAADGGKRTPLHYAVEASSPKYEVVKLLLDYGSNVNALDDTESSPLHYAMSLLHVPDSICLLLLRQGAEVKKKDGAGNSPLYYAVRYRTDLIRSIVARGGDINEADISGETLLHMALKDGQTDPKVILQIIKLGANTNLRDVKGNTPLHMVGGLKVPASEIIRVLIQRGASVHDTNENGDTALHSAMENPGGVEVVRELLFYGSDPLAKNLNNERPWKMALQMSVQVEISIGKDSSSKAWYFVIPAAAGVVPDKEIVRKEKLFLCITKWMLRFDMIRNGVPTIKLHPYNHLRVYDALLRYQKDCWSEIRELREIKVNRVDFALQLATDPIRLMASDDADRQMEHMVKVLVRKLLKKHRLPIMYLDIILRPVKKSLLTDILVEMAAAHPQRNNHVLLSEICLRQVAEHLLKNHLFYFIMALYVPDKRLTFPRFVTRRWKSFWGSLYSYVRRDSVSYTELLLSL